MFILTGSNNFLIQERISQSLAGRVGQLLNMSSLAVETGVDVKTVGAWLGVLETAFVIFRLHPFHKNYNKRIVKTPKLYFVDTGLACALLGISSADQLTLHPFRGGLFENLVVSELKKHYFNQEKPGQLPENISKYVC